MQSKMLCNKLCVSMMILICGFTFLSEGQITSRKTKRPKPSKPAGFCPDTCILKRRVGKLELRFRDELNRTSVKFSRQIDGLRQEYLSRDSVNENTAAPAGDESQTAFRSEILNVVDEKLNGVSDDLRDRMDERYDLLKSALSEVNEKAQIQSSLPQESGGDPGRRELELQNAIDALNLTMLALMRQNMDLMQQTREIRSQTAFLRVQNEARSNVDDMFRRLNRQQDILNADKERVLEVEDKLSAHETRLNSLDSQLEWLTSRADHLSDTADRAQTEAASASEKAVRATQMAKKAIALARRQPASTSEGEDKPRSTATLRQPASPPIDCLELYRLGYNTSGVYRIRPWRSPAPFEVFCEHSYNGGGWTLIQRRRDGSVDFDRDWNEYAQGFGDADGETWLGNHNIHFLTNQDNYLLQVLLLDWEGNRAYAEYEGFQIQSNSDGYALQFGRYTRGNAGDALRGGTDDGSRDAYLTEFTTRDADNDHCSPCHVDRDSFDNCAELQGGGWWFRACSDSNLNGRYIKPPDFTACGHEGCYGVQWRTWRGDPNYSLKASIMLLRRVDTGAGR